MVGEVYRLSEHQDRSDASHRHYFACINEAWENLTEHMAAQFPTPDHLRKFALIKAGHADSRQMVASSKAEAVRLAAFIKPIDDYALVLVDGAVVTVWTARTQNMRAMDRKTFQASKDAVLAIVAEMIGTTPAALSANAGQAA
ncbi:hypothetical protein [Azospirillum sp.]|uniref:hypothetical protein n=1 Tax=Azospirillum sp. TaxID=34012 RepID=UPI003D72BB2F